MIEKDQLIVVEIAVSQLQDESLKVDICGHAKATPQNPSDMATVIANRITTYVPNNCCRPERKIHLPHAAKSKLPNDVIIIEPLHKEICREFATCFADNSPCAQCHYNYFSKNILNML